MPAFAGMTKKIMNPAPAVKMAMSGERVPSPGAADGVCIVLIVVVLIAVTEPLSPGIIIVILGRGPVIRASEPPGLFR
jgi:hypothetical protein